jgi:ribosomal protein S1
MKVKVKVIGIEPEREKVSLSMKSDTWDSAIPRPKREFRKVESGDDSDVSEYGGGGMKGNITFS